MTILITGGAGFVGSSLAIEFKQRNKDERVIAFDNLRRRGSELSITRLKNNGIEFIHGDIRNKEDFDPIGKIDTLIECSAEPSALAGYNSSPDYVINTNLTGTINCLEYARKNQSKFVFLSSSRVYPIKPINNLSYIEKETRFDLTDNQDIIGASHDGISEKFPLEGTRTLYGATKLCSELIIREYVEMYGLKAIIDRCGVLTGSWQMGKVDQGVIVLWVARHLYGQPLTYIGYGGKGKQVRDILHVKDLYRLLEIQLADIDEYNGEIFNVGGGCERSVSLLELTRFCEKYTGKTVPIHSDYNDRAGDIRIYITDNSKVTNRTGWKPTIGVEQIIQELSDWINSNDKMLRPILS